MSKSVRSRFADLIKPRRALSMVALGAALAAWPALADSGYPPGLFENSPVVPTGPPDAAAPSEPPDAADPDVPEAIAPLDDYCASIAGRTFHSLDEVRRAHARCDPPPPGQ